VTAPTGTSPDRLIVVDDDAGVADFVATVARNCGYDVRVALTLNALKEVYATYAPTVIALDLTMPDADGIEVMAWLAEAKCQARIVLISGTAPDLLDAARRLGRAFGLDVAATLAKPFGLAPLAAQLRRLAFASK
jgi:DNA-binding response OmpR family regulator